MDEARLPELTTTEPDGRLRGQLLGSALGEQIESVLDAYLRLFAATSGLDRNAVLRRGEQALERVAGWQPRLVPELEGVAAGADVAPELIAALNARTELLCGGGCSLVARLDDPAGPWLAQNWDWYADAPDRCVVWTAGLEGGERLVTMTEAGILAKLGMNDRGLAVGLNVLEHRRDGGPVGIPIHIVLRALLDSCATVDDAESLIADVWTSASSAITVVDAGGGGATFELSPAGYARIDPHLGRLAHTNHFLAPALGDGEDSETLDESRVRLERLETALPDSLEAAQELLRDHGNAPDSICRHGSPSVHPDLPDSATIVSVASEPAARRFHVAAGTPCTHAYAVYEVLAEPVG
jgi:isopenicillin-N N-acyltransferase-like protein